MDPDFRGRAVSPEVNVTDHEVQLRKVRRITQRLQDDVQQWQGFVSREILESRSMQQVGAWVTTLGDQS